MGDNDILSDKFITVKSLNFLNLTIYYINTFPLLFNNKSNKTGIQPFEVEIYFDTFCIYYLFLYGNNKNFSEKETPVTSLFMLELDYHIEKYLLQNTKNTKCVNFLVKNLALFKRLSRNKIKNIKLVRYSTEFFLLFLKFLIILVIY